MTDRCITVWRKLAPNNLDWDHYVSDSREDAEITIANLRAKGVRQFSTYPIGDRLPDLSSEY